MEARSAPFNSMAFGTFPLARFRVLLAAGFTTVDLHSLCVLPHFSRASDLPST